jgi:hypothetical protein
MHRSPEKHCFYAWMTHGLYKDETYFKSTSFKEQVMLLPAEKPPLNPLLRRGL